MITPETICQIIKLASDEVTHEQNDENLARIIVSEHSKTLSIDFELFKTIMQ
jgi:hypothetical protein